MESEDLEFKIKRMMPVDGIARALRFGEVAMALGAGMLAGIAAYEFVHDAWYSFAGGLVGGVLAGMPFAERLTVPIDHARYISFVQREESLDEEAKLNGAKSITFEYGGQRAECVIREDKPCEFPIESSDSTIRMVRFGYKTDSKYPLAFGFGVPNFLEGHNIQAYQFEIGWSIGEKMEGLFLNFDATPEMHYAVIKYGKPDFMEKMEEFAKTCSYAMERAAKFMENERIMKVGILRNS